MDIQLIFDDVSRARRAEAAGHVFYVSVRSGSRSGLLAGPFSTYDEASRWVDLTQSEATKLDEWAGFYGFGVCSTLSISRPGRLNARLGLPS